MSYYYIYNITDGDTDANRFSTPEDALNRLEQRQAAYNEGLNRIKHLI